MVRSRVDPGTAAWGLCLFLALLVPLVTSVPYFLNTAISALIFVTLAVAFDMVVGRIGALSLAQPVFFGFGAYTGALLGANTTNGFWIELAVAAAGAAILSLVIGIPSFRLSLHAFAIGTLGFQISAQLIAENWVPVTGGPLCVTGIQAIRLPFPGGTWVAASYTSQYYVILAIAALAVGLTLVLSRLRLGLAFSAVRDDPTLATARGLWPTEMRLVAFGISAVLSSAAGVFAAHFQTVVCPDSVDISYTAALLIMVFIGGRASLRGVVTAALLFTVLPQVLRVADEWRLVIYGLLLLVVVSTLPDGLEQIYQLGDRWLRRLSGRTVGGPPALGGSLAVAPTAAGAEPTGDTP